MAKYLIMKMAARTKVSGRPTVSVLARVVEAANQFVAYDVLRRENADAKPKQLGVKLVQEGEPVSEQYAVRDVPSSWVGFQ